MFEKHITSLFSTKKATKYKHCSESGSCISTRVRTPLLRTHRFYSRPPACGLGAAGEGGQGRAVRGSCKSEAPACPRTHWSGDLLTMSGCGACGPPVLSSHSQGADQEPWRQHVPAWAGPSGCHFLFSCVRFFFTSGSWQPVTFARAPARGRRCLLRAPLLPRARVCSWGTVGPVATSCLGPRDSALGSARRSTCPSFPETARAHE